MRTTTWRATAPLFIALILTAGPAAEALADIAPIRVARPQPPRKPPAEAPADKAEPKPADDKAADPPPDGLAAPTDDKAGPTHENPTPAADAAEPVDPAADPAAEPPADPAAEAAAQGEGDKGEAGKPAQINKFEAPTADAKAEGDTPKMGFEAATDEAPKENLPAWPFLYGAYSFLWLMIFAYVVFLWRKQAALEARISAVDKRMDAVDAALEALEAEA